MKPAEQLPEHFDPHVPGVNYGVLDGLIGYALRRAQLRLYEDFVECLSPWNITPPRFAALVIIDHNRDLKLTELARILGVARSGAVTLIDALSGLGYVSRHASRSDRRAFRLVLTSKGKRALAQISQAVEQHDRRIVSMLSPEERDRLMELLRRMAGLSGGAT
ncbi:MAG TPA: MarR family transcriptional regulator [Polyangiales bacterium]